MQRTKRTLRYGWMFLGLGIGLLGLASMSGAQWTETAPMPAPRCYFSTSVVDGKIYAIGGTVSMSSYEGTVEVYDPVADTWTRKADMPTSRWSFPTSVVNGRIYAIGGWGSNTSPPYTMVEEYDPIMDTWSPRAALASSSPRVSASSSARGPPRIPRTDTTERRPWPTTHPRPAPAGATRGTLVPGREEPRRFGQPAPN